MTSLQLTPPDRGLLLVALGREFEPLDAFVE
jgi:hypothetical protein